MERPKIQQQFSDLKVQNCILLYGKLLPFFSVCDHIESSSTVVFLHLSLNILVTYNILSLFSEKPYLPNL